MPKDDASILEIPHGWATRDYQDPLWNALNSGTKRAIPIWHRRAGKDSVGLNYTIKQAITQRPGLYWHLLPTARQGRKVIWEGYTKEGRSFLDFWPKEMITKKRNDEMAMWGNGAKGDWMWQVVGSDNFDSLMGSNPIGVIMSEYSLQDPKAWEFLRPILAENGGWAFFPYTPRGRNHGYDLYNMAKENPDWFAELLTVEDTNVITPEMVETERRAGMPEELIQQEFYCSFEASLVGSYYGDQMQAALDDGRVSSVPHDPNTTVDSWWDLGFTDAMAIWFVQYVGQEIHVIDYYENDGEALPHYANLLQTKGFEEGYKYRRHVMPQDVKVHELQTGLTRVQALQSMGIEVEVAPDVGVADGIEQVRRILPRCWFDNVRCARGLDALRSYRKEEDESRSDGIRTYFKPKPRHDWSSHGADAFRYGALYTPRQAGTKWEPIEYQDWVV